MTVTPEERDAMARLLSVMEGKTPPPVNSVKTPVNQEVILAGAGQVTQADVNAMADVLTRLNTLSDAVVTEMVTESQYNPEIKMALGTTKNPQGVKIGLYQIMIKEDTKRLAGKQYYSIYHTATGDVIADDLSLYETALNVVKMLNKGQYANSPMVRKLFDYDDTYTSRKLDAIRYKRGMAIAEQKKDHNKKDLYESRYQAAVDQAMLAKRNIKSIIQDLGD